MEIPLVPIWLTSALGNTPIQDPLPLPAGSALATALGVPIAAFVLTFLQTLMLSTAGLRPSWLFCINITCHVAWFTLFSAKQMML